MDNEIVIHIAHLGDDPQLIFQPLGHRRIGVFPVQSVHALIAHTPEVGKVVLAVRRRKVGQLGLAELKFHIAPLGDAHRIFKGLVHIGNGLTHLLQALDIELVGLKFQIAGIVHRPAGLDADQNALGGAVLPVDVVGVVGGDQSHLILPGQLDELGQDALLFLNAMVLQLDEEVLPAEDVHILLDRLIRCGIVAGGEHPGNPSRQTG